MIWVLFSVVYALGWFVGGGVVARWLYRDLQFGTSLADRGDLPPCVAMGMLFGLMWPLVLLGVVIARLWLPDVFQAFKIERRAEELAELNRRITERERELRRLGADL